MPAVLPGETSSSKVMGHPARDEGRRALTSELGEDLTRVLAGTWGTADNWGRCVMVREPGRYAGLNAQRGGQKCPRASIWG